MVAEPIYQERVSSRRTLALFVGLCLLCFGLLLWRIRLRRLDPLAVVYLGLVVVFLLYSVNYRTLRIRLSADALRLTFGIITWRVPLENIAACRLDDDIPALFKWGGAGIHFYYFQNHYRASFNFLEHPRLLVAFRRKVGPVGAISFSTRRPQELLALLQQAAAAG